MELAAFRSYSELDFPINFWRTKSGQEVDFVLGTGEVAIEVKGAGRLDHRDLRPLQAFVDRYKPKRAIVVCLVQQPQVYGAITVLPWEEFLAKLWSHELIG
jgi:predicted AAA+ superfamily ATPase